MKENDNQPDRFVELARQIQCDESDDALDLIMGKINLKKAHPPKTKTPDDKSGV